MTGITVRVLENGRPRTREIDTLTDEQLEQWAEAMRENAIVDGWTWAVRLAQWIRDHRGTPIDLQRAADVDLFVRRVDAGIHRLPEQLSAEAAAALNRVIVEAMEGAGG
jgi:hypothetical protein